MMPFDLQNPSIRLAMGLAGFGIYAFIIFLLHRMFVRKLPVQFMWGLFGKRKPPSRFAYCAWYSVFLITALNLIHMAVFADGNFPFSGPLYVLSFGSLVYELTRGQNG